MKIVFYNIAFGTGVNGSWTHYINNIWRFVWTSNRALSSINKTLKKVDGDVICLAEVDNGSFRNGFRCQAKAMANHLKYKFFDTQNKYHPSSIWRWMMLLKNQHDAVLSKKRGLLKKHYLKTGMQKLVTEFITEGVSIFVVHLAVLSKNARSKQLMELSEILEKCQNPYVVCGDFNIHNGLHEINPFLKKTGVSLVKTNHTFPSHKPDRTIDLFLTSLDLNVKNFGIIKSLDSDHLPIWIELENKKTPPILNV